MTFSLGARTHQTFLGTVAGAAAQASENRQPGARTVGYRLNNQRCCCSLLAPLSSSGSQFVSISRGVLAARGQIDRQRVL